MRPAQTLLANPAARRHVTPRRRWWLLAVVLAWAAALWPAPAPAEEVPWLYEVSVPVADQSASARIDAAGEALAELLTRLTGLASVPRNEAVTRALAAPDLYYNQFAFERAAEGDGLQLRLQFTPRAVLELIRDARLPIWRASRPVVVAWVVLDDGRERRILGADTEHPVVLALRERARERGVPLRLPLLDLADQLAVEPAAVWGRLSQTLEPASARYGADIILVGRVQALDETRWAASWEFWIEGEIRDLELEATDPARLGHAAADLVADELAARYAVLDRGLRRLDFVVSAVRSPADYAELLRYFSGLEFVEQIAVTRVAGDQLGVSLVTAAGPDQLLELFQLDQRLFPDLINDAPGGSIGLVWQGG